MLFHKFHKHVVSNLIISLHTF